MHLIPLHVCEKRILPIDTVSLTMLFYRYDWIQNTRDKGIDKPYL